MASKRQRNMMVDDAIAGIIKQDGFSKGTGLYGSCVYRGKNGNKCAVGHLIPDRNYDEKFDKASEAVIQFKAKSGTTSIARRPDIRAAIAKKYGVTDKDIDFLADMQEKLHDHLAIDGYGFSSERLMNRSIAFKQDWSLD